MPAGGAVGVGRGRFTGGAVAAGVGLGVAGGRVGTVVGLVAGVAAGDGVSATAFLFAGAGGVAGTIVPSSQILVRLSLLISNSIVLRRGFKGPSGSAIGFPFISRRAELASDFE